MKKEKDWLSREHRMHIADIAQRWASSIDHDNPALCFSCAATVIEAYLAYGGPESIKIYEDSQKSGLVLAFKRD